jgi:hypothetical protein
MNKIYLGADDGRVGWADTAGETTDPRTFILGDSNLRPIIRDPGEYLYEGDMVMSIPGGKVTDIQKVIDCPGICETLANIKNFVILGLGTNDVCLKGKKVAGITQQVPGIYGHKLKDIMEELIRAIQGKFPGVAVITFDAIPRKSTGFANAWMKVYADRIKRQNGGHSHVSMMARYTLPRRGGKGPIEINKDRFESDGVHLHSIEVGHLTAAMHDALAVRQNYDKFEKRRLTLVRGFSMKF